MHLKAKTVNSTDFPILPGESYVFLDNQFVANSYLDLVSKDEEFWTFLGIDEGIKVERKLVKQRKESVGIFSNNERNTYQYLTKINNKKKDKIELVLWDQLPISNIDDIIVKLQNPAYEEDTTALKINDEKFVEWFFELSASQEIEVPFHFSVEHPEGTKLSGL